MVGAVASAGRAGQDCLWLAGSLMLTHRRCLMRQVRLVRLVRLVRQVRQVRQVRLVRLVRLDRGTPWRVLTAAVNVLTAGALTLAAGIATC